MTPEFGVECAWTRRDTHDNEIWNIWNFKFEYSIQGPRGTKETKKGANSNLFLLEKIYSLDLIFSSENFWDLHFFGPFSLLLFYGVISYYIYYFTSFFDKEGLKNIGILI